MSAPGTRPPPGSGLRDLDVGKIVGAATAPVNLIIAAAIAISFLLGKQAELSTKVEMRIRQIAEDPGKPRLEHTDQQIRMYIRRWRVLNRSAQSLAITVMFFIITVIATLFGVVFPDESWLKLVIGCSMVIGLLLMLAGFAFEFYDGMMESKSIDRQMRDVHAAQK
jgi:hypothetical protein